jgi:hypothetical protein
VLELCLPALAQCGPLAGGQARAEIGGEQLGALAGRAHLQPGGIALNGRGCIAAQ